MSEELELLEKRVTQLEQDMIRLNSRFDSDNAKPWWERS